MVGDDKPKNPVTSMSSYKTRQGFRRLIEAYSDSLPSPSLRFQNLIFLYPEELAVASHDLLFEQLNRRAFQFNQTLVITDVGFDRSGLYVNIDEIGSCNEDPNYDDLIDNWNHGL